MKTLTLITFILLVSFTMANSNPGLEASTNQALQTLHSATTVDEMRPAVNQLERLTLAAPAQWETHYHYAYGNILQSFSESDNRQKDLLLDRAEKAIISSRNAGGDESELTTLQAFIYLARISADGSRAMEYSGMANQYLQKALAANATNPRALYLMGMNVFHTPEPFGGGKTNALPWLEKSVESYRDNKPNSEIQPAWGEEAATQMLSQINNQ